MNTNTCLWVETTNRCAVSKNGHRFKEISRVVHRCLQLQSIAAMTWIVKHACLPGKNVTHGIPDYIHVSLTSPSMPQDKMRLSP